MAARLVILMVHKWKQKNELVSSGTLQEKPSFA